MNEQEAYHRHVIETMTREILKPVNRDELKCCQPNDWKPYMCDCKNCRDEDRRYDCKLDAKLESYYETREED
jgi:hypothetical protein